MSSMRNAVQRRPHRERAQLGSREKWGILEKHKDYSLRARDYNVKKAKLQRLREKARDRNPDEFAFGMMSEKSNKQGRHGARGSEASTLSHEAIKLLKTQDAGYLRVVGEKVRRQLEGVEQEVRLQDGMDGVLQGDTGRKIVFADSLEEQRRLRIEREGVEDEDDDSDEGQFGEEEVSFGEKEKQAKKSKKQVEAEERARREMLAARRLKKRAAEVRRKKVEALQLQHKELVAAEQELDRQRAKMENSVGGVNKYGLKWKVRERKK
ncbi:U3 small nucleolar RNA-associated protein 11 [Blastomyces parvus]|uniref:U3 small nucleolar RNA-associated protein 11 n=1 Tax=Blastomyces parvus TaxID=2060905 RepID=A0A2B7WYS6_9EURO|nr:U3 small nucleolar RNA-associated protein 11 [Blastomyces parvus]